MGRVNEDRPAYGSMKQKRISMAMDRKSEHERSTNKHWSLCCFFNIAAVQCSAIVPV